MSLEVLLAFAAATTVFTLIPGPTVMLTLSNSLRFGLRSGLITVGGAGLALICQLVVVGVGMVSLLAVLADWFEWIRWAGVAYLVYLGVRQWLAKPDAERVIDGRPLRRSRTSFLQGLLVTITNPKGLAFFAAFFPQFIDIEAPLAPQLTVLSILFLVITVGLTAGYAGLAHRARRWFHGARRERLRNRISGSLLIAAGAGLALARRG
jgi:threonine/homoserine/homoserine lactone efflux protein